jgi:carbamoyltransferase
MHILGISALYHDSAACILKDGRIVAAAQEERFTRVKHDQSFPVNAVGYCLKEAGITVADIDYAAFYDKPFLKFERILETYLQFAPAGIKSFLKAVPQWLHQKLWMTDVVENELGYTGTVLFPEHHESHAASAFFPSPFDRAAVLTMDGVGEWATTTYGVGAGNRIDILGELRFPHSPGLLYSAFTYFTGFKVNSGEYKLMGLAPYGQPRYVDRIYDRLIDLKADGSFRMNMEYFDYCAGLTMTGAKFDKLFDGPPRKPEGELTRREMDIAASIQKVTEEIMLRMAGHVKNVTGEKRLCLAGGVALNCVGNGKLLRAGLFDDIWIQPASGDAGGALGAAYIAHCHYLDKPLPDKNGKDMMNGSYLGPFYEDDEIERFFVKNAIPYKHLNDCEIYDIVSDLIADGKVIGWFQGRMEFGPRALGGRSIIGDARNPEMQKRMNLKIKFRESFRPFAPSVLAEKASEWFEIDRESPYMLIVADVVKDKRRAMTGDQQKLEGIDRLNVARSDVPAVTHVDYSARLHTVDGAVNPRFHDLIERFYEKTGCPLVVNTSFNVRGEPIVESPLDAYRCFMRTEMDVLVIEGYVLLRQEQPEFHDDMDWRRTYGLD